MSTKAKNWLVKNLLPIEAIVFDFDNTIVDEEFSVQQRWNVVLSKYEKTLKDNSLRRYFFEIYASKGKDYKYHVDDVLKKLNIDIKIKDSIVEDFLKQESISESLYPYSEALINILHKNKFKLAIYTNGDQKVQERRINLTNIKKYFSYIQYGDSYSKKPSKKGFNNLSKNLKLNPKNNFIMIGDSYEEDLIGSSSVNAKCILVNCPNKYSDQFPLYANVKDLFDDLKEILEQ